MTVHSTILLMSATLLASATAAPGAPQSPDRHQVVAGWQIDDVADPREDDPSQARLI